MPTNRPEKFKLANYRFEAHPSFDFETSNGLVWFFFCQELSTVVSLFPPLSQKEWLENYLIPSEGKIYDLLTSMKWSSQHSVHVVSDLSARAGADEKDTGDLKAAEQITYKKQLEIAKEYSPLRDAYEVYHYLVKETSSFHKIVAFNALKAKLKISPHHSLPEAVGAIERFKNS